MPFAGEVRGFLLAERSVTMLVRETLDGTDPVLPPRRPCQYYPDCYFH